jgi:hypothetical protein
MDWINTPIYKKVRRIDVVLVIAGIVCVAYYGAVAGWLGALQGAGMFALMLMIGLWLL